MIHIVKKSFATLKSFYLKDNQKYLYKSMKTKPFVFCHVNVIVRNYWFVVSSSCHHLGPPKPPCPMPSCHAV